MVGPVPIGTQLTLSIGLPVVTPQGFSALMDFVKQVSDPKQPATFRHFLTQAEFKNRYGATDADYQTLRNWATADNGLSVKTFSNNLLLSVGGSAAQFEQAFNVFLLFRQRADGSMFVSVDRNPSLNLALPILEIDGLTSFVVQQAGVMLNGTGVQSSYRPADLHAAYLNGSTPACSSLTGNGQLVALVEAANFSASDVQLFSSRNSIAIPFLPTIAVQEGGNQPQNAQLEATADVNMVQTLAPDASILYFREALASLVTWTTSITRWRHGPRPSLWRVRPSFSKLAAVSSRPWTKWPRRACRSFKRRAISAISEIRRTTRGWTTRPWWAQRSCRPML